MGLAGEASQTFEHVAGDFFGEAWLQRPRGEDDEMVLSVSALDGRYGVELQQRLQGAEEKLKQFVTVQEPCAWHSSSCVVMRSDPEIPALRLHCAGDRLEH